MVGFLVQRQNNNRTFICWLQASSIEDCQHFDCTMMQCFMYDTLCHSVTLELADFYKAKMWVWKIFSSLSEWRTVRHCASYMMHCASVCDQNVGSPLPKRMPAVNLFAYLFLYKAPTCGPKHFNFVLLKCTSAQLWKTDKSLDRQSEVNRINLFYSTGSALQIKHWKLDRHQDYWHVPLRKDNKRNLEAIKKNHRQMPNFYFPYTALTGIYNL